MKHSFCDDWEFTHHWTEAFGKGLPVPKQQAVRLPHTCREVPLHYATPADYEMVCGYRKRFRVPPVQAAPRLFLRFDGAAHQAVVRVNGRVAGQHQGGYTGFAVEITDLVDREGENLLTVQLDTREDPTIPPFGFVIDYLTYGGLYREVWLEATAESRLTDLFVYTPTLHDAVVQWTAELTPAAVAVRIRLETADGTLLAEQTAQAAETGKMQFSVPDAQPWDTEHPVLHHATAELLNAAGQAIDRKQVTFGFRTAEFRADGFYLNGKKTFLRGLNRHQSYPYIGYAAPESLQREDARVLQEELHCTAVRTSHYPYAEEFYDLCDREGILVMDETPAVGIGGGAAVNPYKEYPLAEHHRQVLAEMIHRDKNHPCVVLWSLGNEPDLEHFPQDAYDYWHPLYELAHQLDPQDRPVTLVCCQNDYTKDITTRTMDIVCINRYYGWYNLSGDMDAACYGLNQELDFWAEQHKPVMMSEYGADTVAGLHTAGAEMFSEEFQVEFYRRLDAEFDKRPWFVGEFVWNFADYDTVQGPMRVDGNKKGLFIRDRRPKLGMHFLRQRWAEIPTFGFKE